MIARTKPGVTTPINDTIRDTLTWIRDERGERRWRNGLREDREKELIAKWRKQQGEGGTGEGGR